MVPRPTTVAVLVLLACACNSQGCQTLPGCPPPEPRSGCPSPAAETFVDPLRHLGRGQGDTFIEIIDVVVDYPIVYACTGVDSLAVWDVSNDAQPALLTDKVAPEVLAHRRFPRCQHVALDKDAKRLIITNRGDEVQPDPFLFMFDVSDPGSPQPLRGWEAAVSIEGVDLVGDRAYVATHNGGVTILEDRGEPTMTFSGNHTDPESDAWQPILVREGVLLVAEGATGVRTYDVTGPDPVLLATLPIPGSSRDVIVEGNLAYVATSGSIAVVDVTDAAAPVLVSQLDAAGTTLGIAKAGPNLVVTAEWDEVRGYDVSDPANLRQVFSETVPTGGDFSRVLAIDADPERGRVYAGEWEGMHGFALSPGRGPEIFTSPKTVQFGNVAPGDSDDAVVVVRNQGDLPLTVHGVVTEDDLVADADCFQVPPGAATPVEVRFEPGGGGEFASAIKFCSDDIDEPEHEVSVSGNIAGLGVGDAAPEFSLRDTEGNTWNSSQLRGNVVVLAYFATF